MELTILECKRFVARSGKPVSRRINHYELDFYVGGKRTIDVDGRKSEISDGYICFRRPGQTASGTGDYNCYVATLDFYGMSVDDFNGRQAIIEPRPEFRHELIDSIPDAFRVFHKNEILSRFMYISNLVDCGSENARTAMLEILFLVNADLCRAKLDSPGKDESAPERIIKYINENYKADIGLCDLAKLVNLDKSYLIRQFKTKYGISPGEYLIDFRLNQARTLLLNTDMQISGIASECGYNSTSFFVSSFRARFGCTPGTYRQNGVSKSDRDGKSEK